MISQSHNLHKHCQKFCVLSHSTSTSYDLLTTTLWLTMKAVLVYPGVPSATIPPWCRWQIIRPKNSTTWLDVLPPGEISRLIALNHRLAPFTIGDRKLVKNRVLCTYRNGLNAREIVSEGKLLVNSIRQPGVCAWLSRSSTAGVWRVVHKECLC